MYEDMGDVQETADRIFADTIQALIHNSREDEVTPEMAERFATSARLMTEKAIEHRPLFGHDGDIDEEEAGAEDDE